MNHFTYSIISRENDQFNQKGTAHMDIFQHVREKKIKLKWLSTKDSLGVLSINFPRDT